MKFCSFELRAREPPLPHLRQLEQRALTMKVFLVIPEPGSSVTLMDDAYTGSELPLKGEG
jgi:hypothetical protein